MNKKTTKSNKRLVTSDELRHLSDELMRFSERARKFAEEVDSRGPNASVLVGGAGGTTEFLTRLISFLGNVQQALDLPVAIYEQRVAEPVGEYKTKRKPNRKKESEGD
jgi:hypothetical protein